MIIIATTGNRDVCNKAELHFFQQHGMHVFTPVTFSITSMNEYKKSHHEIGAEVPSVVVINLVLEHEAKRVREQGGKVLHFFYGDKEPEYIQVAKGDLVVYMDGSIDEFYKKLDDIVLDLVKGNNHGKHNRRKHSINTDRDRGSYIGLHRSGNGR